VRVLLDHLNIFVVKPFSLSSVPLCIEKCCFVYVLCDFVYHASLVVNSSLTHVFPRDAIYLLLPNIKFRRF
jgi:hypothetical protein